jgi:parvulin-like peptidyl-prolyl isomerase
MNKQRIAAIVFGLIVVIALVVAGTTSGIGKGDVPDGSIAKVDGDEITEETFETAMDQAMQQQGLTERPAAGTEEYNQLRDAAMGQLLDAAWIEGEAAEQGVEASDREIADQLQQVKDQQFKTEKEFQDFIVESGFTPEDVNDRIRLQILSDKLEQQINQDVPQVSDDEAKDFYEENSAQFEQPASRDIRLILSKNPEDIEDAKQKLEADNSDEEWAKIAKKYSTDAATKDAGGVRAGITAGTLEGDLDAAVFDAPLNTIEGPVETPLGTYIFEVTKDTPKTTQPFEEVSQQLIQQIQGQKQQEVFSAFIEDYRSRWADLTICADGFVIDRCDNFKGSAAEQECTEEQAKETGCPPLVTGRSPIAPGTNSLLGGGAAGGAPQGPHPAGEDQDPAAGGGAIPGGVPGGAGGAVPVSPAG